MAGILSVATATPPHRIGQDEAKQLAGSHFAGRIQNVEKYLTVFDNSLVRERYFCVEPEWFFRDIGVGDANRVYLEWAPKLAVEAAEKCLERAAVAPDAIDAIVFVSSTGIATPSLDVAVINRMGLRADARRVPLFGLGCGGGAAGIAVGSALASARPGTTVLLVAVELNSLTFQRRDYTKSNLVASSLFGDGAAAVLVRGGDGPIQVVDSVTHLKPGSERLMGWDFADSGFRVVFSQRIPAIIREMMPGALERILAPRNLSPDDVDGYVVHPGGRKILEAYAALLGRESEAFASGYHVLERYGNMSSATVLFVLEEEIEAGGHAPGDLALLAAFGPGFCAEASLLRWS